MEDQEGGAASLDFPRCSLPSWAVAPAKPSCRRAPSTTIFFWPVLSVSASSPVHLGAFACPREERPWASANEKLLHGPCVYAAHSPANSAEDLAPQRVALETTGSKAGRSRQLLIRKHDLGRKTRRWKQSQASRRPLAAPPPLLLRIRHRMGWAACWRGLRCGHLSSSAA